MTARTIIAAGFAALGLASTTLAQTASPPEAPGAAAATSEPAAMPATDGTDAAAVTSGAAPAQAQADTAAADAAAPPADQAPAAEATASASGLPPDTEAVTFENGRWYNAEGIPTYKIEDGVVDYATFSGYRRYHAECHVCHGPDGEGSTYAPALKNSVMHVTDYWDYQQIVASGKQNVGVSSNLVMPAFGTNRNVWCYVDDIYTYLLARGTEAIPRGRPAKKAEKSDEFAAVEDSCMAG